MRGGVTREEEKTKPESREERLMLIKEPSIARMVLMKLRERVATPGGSRESKALP